MKILTICGSPRKGNTELLLREALNSAEKAGASVDLVLLKDLEINHCDGCSECETTGKCGINDDMQELYRRVEASDAIIIGSPNYYSNVSGMLKDFIDRTLVYYETDKLKGKLGGIVTVGGGGGKDAAQILKRFLSGHGIKVLGVVEAAADKLGEVADDKQALSAARELGKKIVTMK
jgi:multimeric flavodoxin WrbA